MTIESITEILRAHLDHKGFVILDELGTPADDAALQDVVDVILQANDVPDWENWETAKTKVMSSELREHLLAASLRAE